MAYRERAGANSEEAKQTAKEQYFNEYGWTEDMWDMFNEIYDMAKAHPVFNFMGGVSTDVAKTWIILQSLHITAVLHGLSSAVRYTTKFRPRLIR